MFKIDFSVSICYYLFVSMLLFFLVWFNEKKTAYRRRVVSNSQIWQCYTCTYVYFESKNSRISTCPQCGSFNERGQNKGG